MKRPLILSVIFLSLCLTSYLVWWVLAAGTIKDELLATEGIESVSVQGFPGLMSISGKVTLSSVTPSGLSYQIIVPEFIIEGLPVKFINTTLTLPEGGLIKGHIDSDVWSIDYLQIAGPLPMDFPSSINSQNLRAWREQEGQILIEHFNFSKNSLSGEGTGKIALDESLQPVATINARLQGHSDFINFLAQKKLIDSRSVMLAHTILNGLSSPSDDGDNPYLDIGISLMNQTLYAGPLAVAQLPRFDWDSGNRPALHQ